MRGLLLIAVFGAMSTNNPIVSQVGSSNVIYLSDDYKTSENDAVHDAESEAATELPRVMNLAE